MTQFNISVSTLPYLGLGIGKMLKLPKEIGIEIFAECGNDYYWSHWLPRLLEGRKGEFSIHAPFQNMDLSNPEADFAEILKNYRWGFEICKNYGGKHCVCHPYESARPEAEPEENRKKAQECSLRRVRLLNSEAKKYGITLLVENMPYANPLFSQEEFIKIFSAEEDLHFLIDTGHAHMTNWDMQMTFEKLGSRILGFHLHDNMGKMDSHLHIGEGSIDWEQFFAGCVKYTPQASLVCEYDYGTIDEVLKSIEKIQELINKSC